ncbi:rhamnosyltransferase WsaF family glycosyltransferase, partial [Acetobacter orientalis]
YPGLETLFDEVEINYIGDRYAPLKISPHDEVVATVWYSAYFAKKIMSLLKEKPFLYLIQDYEAAFYPYNSLYALAHETYNFNYHAIVSTKTLLNFMRNRVSHFNNLYLENKAIYFNNACSAKLSDKNTFLKKHNKKTKKLAFYSRPSVNRNMFELGALALIKAWQEGYFDSGHNWELYGIGIGNVEIYLSERDKLTQLPRMSLNEYEEKIGEFDICLSLMASPHPSITPFDLAGIGALVVTNSFENKGDDYFNEITDNIIVSEPTIDSIANAIKSAIKRVDDLDTRYSNANKMNYPRNWNNVWSLDHKNFVKNIFGAPNCN